MMDRREFIKWMAATAVVAERGGVFAQDARMKQKDNSMSKWIWLSPFVYPQHQHCRKDTYSSPKVTDGPGFAVVQFKKVVDCGGAVDSIRFRASGDTRFRIFLNGERLWTGPAEPGSDWIQPSTPPQYFADEYVWKARDGKKPAVLEFLAEVRLGPMRGNEMSRGQGGFRMDADVQLADGKHLAIGTRPDWQCRLLSGWQNGSTFDARIPAIEWTAANVVEDIWHEDVAPIPVRDEWTVKPLEGGELVVQGGATSDAHATFDRIYAAYLVMEADAPCEITARMYEQNPRALHATEKAILTGGDSGSYFCSLALQSIGGIQWNVKSLDAARAVHAKVYLIATCYPVRQEGSFHCSDKGLDAVYDVCKWTLQICRQTMHLDSPKHQEPLACTGDYYIEAMMTAGTFGDMRLAALDVLRTAQVLQLSDGRLFHTTYSLIWVHMMWEVYQFTGDKELLKQCLPALDKLLGRFRKYMGENGLIDNPPDYMFVDWLVVSGQSMHHPPKSLGQTVLNCFYHGALLDAARVYAECGKTAVAQTCNEQAAALQKVCRALLYDSEKQLFFDGLPGTEPAKGRWMPANTQERHFSRHANTLAVLCDVVTGAEAAALLERTLDSDMQEVQPYFMHYVLEAVEKCGLFEKRGLGILRKWIPLAEECPRGLKEGWIAPQADYGFDYSHAWGGTPAWQLPARLLGFKMLEPGFAKISLSPRLCGLEWFDISMPTPKGMLRCRLEKGKTPQVDLPAGLACVMQ